MPTTIAAPKTKPAPAAEEDFLPLQMGLPARIHLDAYPELVFSGRLEEMAPIARSGVLTDAGVYAASLAREYCLVWEAGPAGALVDYRLRLRPAAR